jgi:hypothetical protein
MSSIQTFLERIANNYSPEKFTSGEGRNIFSALAEVASAQDISP